MYVHSLQGEGMLQPGDGDREHLFEAAEVLSEHDSPAEILPLTPLGIFLPDGKASLSASFTIADTVERRHFGDPEHGHPVVVSSIAAKVPLRGKVGIDYTTKCDGHDDSRRRRSCEQMRGFDYRALPFIFATLLRVTTEAGDLAAQS